MEIVVPPYGQRRPPCAEAQLPPPCMRRLVADAPLVRCHAPLPRRSVPVRPPPCRELRPHAVPAVTVACMLWPRRACRLHSHLHVFIPRAPAFTAIARICLYPLFACMRSLADSACHDHPCTGAAQRSASVVAKCHSRRQSAKNNSWKKHVYGKATGRAKREAVNGMGRQ